MSSFSTVVTLKNYFPFLGIIFILLATLFSYCHHQDKDVKPIPTSDQTTSTNSTLQQSTGSTDTDPKTTDLSNTATNTTPAEIIPPSWNIDPYIDQVTYKSFDVSFEINELGLVYYKLETTNQATNPTSDAMKTNNQFWQIDEDHKKYTFTVTQIRENEKIVPDTEYTLYVLAEDLWGNRQQEPVELTLHTAAYPYLEWYKSYPSMEVPEVTFIDIYYKFKEKDATSYYVVEPCDLELNNCIDPISLPLSDEIQLKAMSAENPQKVATKADIAGILTVEGLTGLTKYIIYLVAEDGEEMLQPTVSYLIFETQPAEKYSDIIISYVFQSSAEWKYNCCKNEAGIETYDVSSHMRFIELRNVSLEDKDIGSWSLQFYHNLTGNNDFDMNKVVLIPFPDNTIIPAGKSFLIGGSKVHDVLEPDFNLFNFSFPNGLSADFLNDSGKGIALVRNILPVEDRSDGDIEDQMGYVVDDEFFPYFGEGDIPYIKKDQDTCGANFRRKIFGIKDTNHTSEDWEVICEDSFVPPKSGSSIALIEPPVVKHTYPGGELTEVTDPYNSEVKFDTFEIEFNEDMNFAHGYIEIEGGNGALRPTEHFYQLVPSFNIEKQRWVSPNKFTFDLVGLNSDTHYQFTLKDFRDNRNDMVSADNGSVDQPYLLDIYLDVITQPAVPPVVIHSIPTDNPAGDCTGDIRCPDRGLSMVHFQFSEEMNKDTGEVTITGGSAEIPYHYPTPYWWNSTGELFTTYIDGLADSGSYQLTLSGFKDIFGYELDDISIQGKLGDNGTLDLTTQPITFEPRLQFTQVHLSSGDWSYHQVEIWNNTNADINFDDPNNQYFLGFYRLIPETNTWCDPEPCVPTNFPPGLVLNDSGFGWSLDLDIMKLAGGTVKTPATVNPIEECWHQKAADYGYSEYGCADGDNLCVDTYCYAYPTDEWLCECPQQDVWIVGGAYVSRKNQAFKTKKHIGWNYSGAGNRGGALLLLRCDTCATTDLYSNDSAYTGQMLQFPVIPMDQWGTSPRDILVQKISCEGYGSCNPPTLQGEPFSVQILDVFMLHEEDREQYEFIGYHQDTSLHGFQEYRKIFGEIMIYEDSYYNTWSRISPFSFVSTGGIFGKFPDIP